MIEKEKNGHANTSIRALKGSDPVPFEDEDLIALIDNRRLERECFVRSIEVLHPRTVVLSYSSAAEFVEASKSGPVPLAVLLNIGRHKPSDQELCKEFEALKAAKAECPLVVLASSDELEDMICAFEAGASGYVPASVGIDEIVEAVKLTALGGVFLKRESLAKVRSAVGQSTVARSELQNLTWKQSAVAEALRRGKANKTIAYELNMCESTVKVHIRNIMRKLNATNRTEAAFKLNMALPLSNEDD